MKQKQGDPKMVKEIITIKARLEREHAHLTALGASYSFPGSRLNYLFETATDEIHETIRILSNILEGNW